jgi:hypothetical protein
LIGKKPALGLDPRVEAGFTNKIMRQQKLKRQIDSAETIAP